MSFENKYRVHEVAKDFGKQTKDITQILTTYATAPKNHMQVLSDKELSIVFEYMTQHNQVADMQASLATAPKGGENRGRNDRNDRNDRGGDRNRNDRGDRNGQQGQRRDPVTAAPVTTETTAASRTGRAARTSTTTRPPSPAARTTSKPSSPRTAPPAAYLRRSWWTPARAAT